jgi:hypothetical protein
MHSRQRGGAGAATIAVFSALSCHFLGSTCECPQSYENPTIANATAPMIAHRSSFRHLGLGEENFSGFRSAWKHSLRRAGEEIDGDYSDMAE